MSSVDLNRIKKVRADGAAQPACDRPLTAQSRRQYLQCAELPCRSFVSQELKECNKDIRFQVFRQSS